MENTISKHKRVWKSKWDDKRRYREINFRGKRLRLGWNPKKGQCKDCKQFFKLTHLHHWFYLIIMPWACTIELCPRCHRKLLKK